MKSSDKAADPKKVSFRTILWQAGVFLLYLLVLDRILFYLPVSPKAKSQNPYLAKIEQYRALADTPDVVFMGSSRIWMGVDPSVVASLAEDGLDITAYNFGASATTPAVHYLFLRDVVLPGGKPRLIVLEVAAREMNGRNGRNDKPLKYLTRMSDVPAFLAHTKTIGEAKSLVFSNLFASSRRFSDVRAWIAGKEEKKPLPGGDDPVQVHHDDGWLEYTYSPPVTWEEKKEHWRKVYSEEVLVNYRIDGIPDYSLCAFLELARESGIPVILVNLPITAEQMEFFTKNEYKTFMEYVRARADEYAVDFRDYNTPETRPPLAMFHDTHHLNAEGSRTFSLVLARDVVEPFFKKTPGKRAEDHAPDSVQGE